MPLPASPSPFKSKLILKRRLKAIKPYSFNFALPSNSKRALGRVVVHVIFFSPPCSVLRRKSFVVFSESHQSFRSQCWNRGIKLRLEQVRWLLFNAGLLPSFILSTWVSWVQVHVVVCLSMCVRHMAVVPCVLHVRNCVYDRTWRNGKHTVSTPSSLATCVPGSQQNNWVQFNLSLQIDPKNN